MIKKDRLGQEEMVGFAVIVIIIGVILLVALGFFLRNPTESGVESYEIESFVQSSLQFTTDCESEIELLSLQKLITACNNEEKCLDERDSCEVLNSTLGNLVESSWQAGNGSAIKGYNLKVRIDEQTKLEIKKGNETSNYKSGFQGFAKGGDSYEVSLDVYS